MVTLDYHGVEGRGRTVTEAKRAAGERIRGMIAGDYVPRLLTHRGYAVLVWREPEGWCSRLVVTPDDGVRGGLVYGHANDRTREDAAAGARRHLAQLGWVEADGHELPGWLTREDVRELSSWVEFQLRHGAARRAGLGSNDCHDYAGRNPSRADMAELVKRVEG